MKVLKSIFHWFANHMPTKRRLIQIYCALLYNCNIKGFINGRIYTGNTKYICTPGLNCYSCPGAVAACPLGAMQNAFASSGTRAPFYVLGILGLLGLMLGRTICGFLCPVGLGQDLLYKIKTPKIKKSRYTRALSYVKYVILVVFAVFIPLMYGIFQNAAVPAFCKYICPAGTFGGGIGLLINPANSDYFAMLGPLFTWKFCLLVAIIVFCVFMYRPFCRFICPLGAIYGFFNKIAIIGVKLDNQKCTDCGLCISHCKMDVKHVGDHECINCGECMSVCPVKAISWKGSKLFLKGNAYEEQLITEERPLTPLLAVSAIEAAPAPSDSPVKAEFSTYDETVDTEDVSNKTEINQSEFNQDELVQDEPEQNEPEQNEPVQNEPVQDEKQNNVKPKNKRSFYLQLTAFSLALLVFIGAVLYANVFADSGSVNAVGVNDIAPGFTLKTYGFDENGKYALLDKEVNSLDYSDRVLIVNFWATWCQPCKDELPEFNELQIEHPEIKILAIHSTNITDDVAEYVAEKKSEFTTYKIDFLQDEIISDKSSPYYGQTILQTFGGKDVLPITIIIVKGVVKIVNNGKMDKATLLSVLEPYL